MKLIFEFARIAAFCFAGEVCHLVLPLPIPASVYGLMLLLAALRFGVVKLEQVRTAALFLTGIFPPGDVVTGCFHILNGGSFIDYPHFSTPNIWYTSSSE